MVRLCAEILASNFFPGCCFSHIFLDVSFTSGFLEERVERSLEQILDRI